MRIRVLFIGLALGPAPVAAQSRAPLLQSVEVQIHSAPAIASISGGRYLVYELHLTNLRPVEVVLQRIEVVDANSGRQLVEYRDDQLRRRLGRPGVSGEIADSRVIAGGMRAVLYCWVEMNGLSSPPARLSHRIHFETVSSTGRVRGEVEGVEVAVRQEPALVLDPPLRGGPWVALYDPALPRGHRTSIYTMNGRARIPARFAIDWIRLDEDGSRAKGDASRVADWHGYGAEVLAVADAVVADARDDMQGAETVGPAQGPMPLENASGNYVVLDLGRGRFAIYEHLRQQSVRVKPGERVRRGQVIAQLGNTGSSSSGPHLHFHVADGASLLGSEGLPYGFRSFEVLGGYDAIDGFMSGQRWKPLASGSGVRRQELPGANVVVKFPD